MTTLDTLRAVHAQVEFHKRSLKLAGAATIQSYGYPDATPDTITQNPVYRMIFLKLLGEAEGVRPAVDKAIQEILEEIE